MCGLDITESVSHSSLHWNYIDVQIDMDRYNDKESEDVYETFNVLVRRKPKVHRTQPPTLTDLLSNGLNSYHIFYSFFNAMFILAYYRKITSKLFSKQSVT